MNSVDLLSMGLRNLFRRKIRTFLTVLGVIIGTASIVTMLSLGFGMKQSFEEQIAMMGSMTVIEVMPSYDGGYGMGGRGGRGSSGTALDDKAVAQFAQIPGVVAVSPEVQSYVRFVAGRYVADLPVRGIKPEVMEYFVGDVKEGRLLQKGDDVHVVFGGQTVYFFFNPKARDPWRFMGPSQEGQEPVVNVLKDKLSMTFDMSYGMSRSPLESPSSQKPPLLFKVKGVGILEQGQSEHDYYAFMDIDQLKKFIQENARYQGGNDPASRQYLEEQLKYQRVLVKVEDMSDVERVQNAIREMGFQTYSLNDILESMENTYGTIQLILGGIGAVSLLVAALGITNTMIMSIYERTREIGIMKVIGASLKDIKRLFLFEAGMLGFMGGVFGIAISFLLSFALNVIANQAGMFMGMGGGTGKISVIPVWLVFAVIGLSTLVGLVSGYYPARRAMKLSAIEAIRND